MVPERDPDSICGAGSGEHAAGSRLSIVKSIRIAIAILPSTLETASSRR
jgi:hypothetical protein